MKRIQRNSKSLLVLLSLFSFLSLNAQSQCYDQTVIDASVTCYPMGMPGVYCGCDGNIYSSSCEAYYHFGVTSGVWSMDGSCSPQGGCKASFYYWSNGGTDVQF